MRTALIAAILALAQSASFASNPKASSASQPLTYQNIVKHLTATGLRATEVQKRCTVFFDGEWKNADIYNYAVILVENSDEDVQISFYLTDAHEMNWITEFLDAPFFTAAETQKLFGLVNGHGSTDRAIIGRYRVEFHHWRPKHADIFVFSFTPVPKGQR